MSLLPFWNRAGEMEKLEGIPTSSKDWEDLENLDNANIRELINLAQALLHRKATSASLLSEGINLASHLFGLDSVVVRRSNPVDDPDDQQWRNRKFSSETYLLRWLQEHSDITVPRLLEVYATEDNDLNTTQSNLNFIIMNKVPGSMLMNLYGNLPASAKERLVCSYAEVMLKLFSLVVPQKIGSLSPGSSLNDPDVAPMFGLWRSTTADRVFCDIKEFFDFLFSVKRRSKFIGEDETSRKHAAVVLGALEVHVHTLLHVASAPLLRVVLVHDDPNYANLLIDDSGTICGIVDWEFHSLRPLILAAAYPPWLDYDDCEDPRFCPDNTWWLESPDESKRLCGIFEEIVEKKNPDFYAALTQGRLLRSAAKWLADMSNDYGCQRLKMWMDDAF